MSRPELPPKTVEFFFDFMSPAAYLAHTQLPAMIARTGARVVHRPMLTLKLHELTGNRSPMAVPNKAAWALRDLKRFARRYGVPFAFNRNFPMEMLDVLHGAFAVQGSDVFAPYCDAVYRAVWVDGVDVDDRAALARHLDAAGVDAAGVLSRVDDPRHHDALMATTSEAAARGAFGAPTFFVADEMHFGQDRLDFVEEALAR